VDNFSEELALERFAVIEHERKAEQFWQQGNFSEYMRERLLEVDARAHVRQLEAHKIRT
jgi:hypothetical protein